MSSNDSFLQYRYVADGAILFGRLEPELAARLEMLPYNHASYFDLSLPHVFVPIEELIASRARPKGITNANRLMKQAVAGSIAGRAPISVERIGEGAARVLDGNSTFLNALYSGWPDIPCTMAGNVPGRRNVPGHS